MTLQQNIYATYPVYSGDDLGLRYTPEQSSFRIWSPLADAAEIIFYDQGEGGYPVDKFEMVKGDNGTWTIIIQALKQGLFYVFRVCIDGEWSSEVPDPYAGFVGVNGKRAKVVAESAADPEGWSDDSLPSRVNQGSRGSTRAAVIYEMHIRDMTIHPSSGVWQKGKYLGLTERGTVNGHGLRTALDHLIELGITHIQLLPVFDFYSVDENNPDGEYNWGYDPLNLNTTEGSYATNAHDGITRVKELKEFILVCHQSGIKVIIDIAFNHTALSAESSFSQLVPGYYYRHQADGSFSNASGCGNETASERPMMQKFMVDTLCNWVRKFHVDGFRIDLMGVHDIETINMISKKLHQLNPGILLYGEGWSANPPLYPEHLLATKNNVSQLHGVAVFCDEFRDGIKGSVFFSSDPGFISGHKVCENSVKFGIVGACAHPQVEFNMVNYSDKPYAVAPHQVIAYCECHDNLNLWDKLAVSATEYSLEQRLEMHLLGLSIVLTSQGIPFLHAGSEFLRTKYGVDNSYDAGDAVNAIDWNLKSLHYSTFEYVRHIIAMRRAHPVFTMPTAEMVAANLFFLETSPGIIAYTIHGESAGDSWQQVLIIHNGSPCQVTTKLPEGNWVATVFNNRISSMQAGGSFIRVNPFSTTILYR